MKGKVRHSKIILVCVFIPYLVEILTTQFGFPFLVETILLTYVFSMFYYVLNMKLRFNDYGSGRLILFWILLIIISLFTSIRSIDILLSLKRVGLILITSLILIILVSLDKNKIMTLRLVLKVFVRTSVVLTIISLIINFFGYHTIDDNWRVIRLDIGPFSLVQRISGVELIGISSLFYNPNNFAGYLLIGLASAFITIKEKGSKYGISSILSILLIYLGIILSLSRSAIVLSVFIPLMVRYFSEKYSIKHFLIVLMGLIVTSILLIFSYNLKLGIELSGRDLIWSNLFSSFQKNPVFGVGFGVSYETILGPLGMKGAHNVYLLVLSEIGILGLSVFISINIGAILYSIKKMKFFPQYRELASTALTLVVLILFYEIFEGGLMGFSSLNFFWIYLLSISYADACRPLMSNYRYQVVRPSIGRFNI